MPEPVLGQLSSFLLFILGGIALGLAYDLLRAVRATLHPHGPPSFLLDLSYWLLAFAIVFPLLVIGTWGDPRLFVWLTLSMGAAYYLLVLSRLCRPLVSGLVRLMLNWILLPGRLRHRVRWEQNAKHKGKRIRHEAGGAKRE